MQPIGVEKMNIGQLHDGMMNNIESLLEHKGVKLCNIDDEFPQTKEALSELSEALFKTLVVIHAEQKAAITLAEYPQEAQEYTKHGD